MAAASKGRRAKSSLIEELPCELFRMSQTYSKASHEHSLIIFFFAHRETGSNEQAFPVTAGSYPVTRVIKFLRKRDVASKTLRLKFL